MNSCEQCGNPASNRFCGRSCSNKWQHAHGVRKGGFKGTLLEMWTKKYGLEEALCRETERNKKHSESIRGRKNHFFGKDHDQTFKDLSSRIHKGKVISEETRVLMSRSHVESIAAGKHDPGKNYGKGGWFQNKRGQREYFSSSFEKKRMEFFECCSDVLRWTKKHKIVISYVIEGRNRSYAPDFLVHLVDGRVFLEEVKGWIRDPKEFEAKNKAAQFFCELRGWKYKVIFENDLFTPEWKNSLC